MMAPCSQKVAHEATGLVTEAAPFYPHQQPRQVAYNSDQKQDREHEHEHYVDPYDEQQQQHQQYQHQHHYYQYASYEYQQQQSQPQSVELPKKKSLADLGLDSLGFVSDEDDDSTQETTSPLTYHTQQCAMNQPEGGEEGEGPPPAYAASGAYHSHMHDGAYGHGHGAEQQQDNRSVGTGGGNIVYYSHACVPLHHATTSHDPAMLPHQQQYEQHFQHHHQPGDGIDAQHHQQHQYANGGGYPGGWSQYPRHHQHQYHQQYPPEHHQHHHEHEEQGGGQGVVNGYATWEGVSRNGGIGPEEMGDLDEHEFLTFLQESFPGYSLESLEELLAANNHDISLTVEMLTDLDIEEKPPEPPPLDDESNFPTLRGGDGAGEDNNNKGPGVDNRPPSPPTEIFRSFTISGGRSNVRGGASAMTSSVVGADENGNFADRVRTQTSIPTPLTAATERRSVQVGYGSGHFGGGGAGRGSRASAAASHQPWVETGEAVSNLYTSTREDARDHMRLRNICFQQATQAYLTGNKALAKDLSRKGRNHARAMRAAHEEAAGTVFRERNANIQPQGTNNAGGVGGPRMFDLHGLHVAEAVAVLRRELPNCRAIGERVVHVLVGTGHHVKGSRTPARLPAAIAEFLHASRIRYWEPQAGMLEVDVASVVVS